MGQNQGAQYLNYLNLGKFTNLWANSMLKYQSKYTPKSQRTDTILLIGMSFKLISQNIMDFDKENFEDLCCS